MKKTTLIFFCVLFLALSIFIILAFVLFSKSDNYIPITGGYGVELGEVLTPKLKKRLNAKIEEFINGKSGFYYRYNLEETLFGFNDVIFECNEENKIHRIELTNITLDAVNVFEKVKKHYEKKYGTDYQVINRYKQKTLIASEMLYIDKKNKSRTIRIVVSPVDVRIIYADVSLVSTDVLLLDGEELKR